MNCLLLQCSSNFVYFMTQNEDEDSWSRLQQWLGLVSVLFDRSWSRGHHQRRQQWSSEPCASSGQDSYQQHWSHTPHHQHTVLLEERPRAEQSEIMKLLHFSFCVLLIITCSSDSSHLARACRVLRHSSQVTDLVTPQSPRLEQTVSPWPATNSVNTGGSQSLMNWSI